jgi:hypothetical protein
MKLRSFIACGLMTAAVSAGETSHYTAHEWGTFTSVQGSDGQPIQWNPFTESDLPNFVHTRRKPADGPAVRAQALNLGMLMSKQSTHWFQRMETPVIYFHTEKPLRLTATVKFPTGLITEWYPAATTYGPVFGVTNLFPDVSASFATWTDLEILPLTLQPAPAALARVFVGRAELIPVDLERRAESLAERFHKTGDKSAAQELGKLVVPRFADSLLNRLHSRELAASENWLNFEPSLEPIAKRREAATVTRNERFNALRAAVFPKPATESASLPDAGSIFSTAATVTP